MSPHQGATHTPFKYWCFTLNNPYIEPGDELFIGHHQYLIYQMEVADTGTLHFQGYVVMKKRTRLTAMKKLVEEAHFGPRKGTREQAKKYCMKMESQVLGPWEFGSDSEVSAGQGERKDMNDIRDQLLTDTPMTTIQLEHFGSWCRYEKSFEKFRQMQTAKPTTTLPIINVLWGPPGTGKTHRANELCPDAFWLSRPMTNDTLWWDGYQNGKDLVIDEFSCWMRFEQLLRILDKYPFKVPVKGAMVEFNSPKIVITSNFDPFSWYTNGKVKNVDALHRRLRDHCIITHLEEPYAVTAVQADQSQPSQPFQFNLQ